MRKLIFIVGGAGAGKTTVAKALAGRRRAAFFDMDTLSRPASEAIMRQAGLDPADRDSEAYKARCRDLGYRLTMDAALENVGIGTDAFVVGPFTRETEDPAWLDNELSAVGASLGDVDVKAIVVHLGRLELYRRRIEQRQSPLDRWKLDNWEAFSRSLAARDIKWRLGPDAVLRFDNSEPLTDDRIALLERFVYGGDADGPR